jgi:hypothetical protein
VITQGILVKREQRGGLEASGVLGAAYLLFAHEARDSESQCELRLAGAPLAVDLGDVAGLDAAAQDLVERRRARCDADDLALPLLQHRACSLKADPAANLARGFLGLEHLGLGEPLDLLELACRRHDNGVRGVQTRLLELLDVTCGMRRHRALSCLAANRAGKFGCGLAAGRVRARAVASRTPRAMPTASSEAIGVKDVSCSSCCCVGVARASSRRTVAAI